MDSGAFKHAFETKLNKLTKKSTLMKRVCSIKCAVLFWLQNHFLHLIKRKCTICIGTIRNVCAIALGYGISFDMHDNWTNECDDDSLNGAIDDVAIDRHAWMFGYKLHNRAVVAFYFQCGAAIRLQWQMFSHIKCIHTVWAGKWFSKMRHRRRWWRWQLNHRFSMKQQHPIDLLPHDPSFSSDEMASTTD